MKYWILALSLLVLGCGGGESSDAGEESAESVGAAAADAMIEAQDKAAEVGDMLEEKKEEIDAAVDDADNN